MRDKKNKVKKSLKRKLLRDSGGKCESCGSSGDRLENPLEPHHITPVSEGGEVTRENLRIVCRRCHVTLHL